MKKLLLNLAAVAMVAAMPATANAEILLSDDFDYNTGNLYNQGGWVKMTKNENQPIQVVNTPLTYSGYQNEAAGKAVALAGGTDTKAQRLQKQISGTEIKTGVLYYSLIVNPSNAQIIVSSTSVLKYIISGFTAANYSGWDDGVGNTTPVAALSIVPKDNGKFSFGIAAGASQPTCTSEYDLNQTYLAVVKYDFSTKDISLWINPTSASDEPSIKLTGVGSINGSSSYGVRGICLYQQAATNITATVTVDAVRVVTDMADLFDNSGSADPGTGTGEDPNPGEDPNDPQTNPEAVFETASISFDAIFKGTTSAKTVSILGSDLTQDLTITSSDAAFKVSPSTISAADAMEGAEVTITYAPATAGSHSATITIKHGDATLATATVSGEAEDVTSFFSCAALSNDIFDAEIDDYTFVSVASTACVVTAVDGDRFFIQDMSGAICVKCFNDAPVAVGNKFSGFIMLYSEGDLWLYYYDEKKITTGTPKSATPVSISDIIASPSSYWNKLVKLEDLTFENGVEGNKFGASSQTATDGDGNSIFVRPFSGCSLIGTQIPAKADVTGIVVSKNGNSIWPRSIDDITVTQNATTGIESIDADRIGAKTVYNLQGVRVNAGSNLPTGLYIINGKKTFVK